MPSDRIAAALEVAVLWMLGIPLLCMATGAFGWAAMQFEPVRQQVRDRLAARLERTLGRVVEIEDLRWPRFDRVELHGFAVFGRDGSLAVAASSATADVRLRSILAGRLDIRALEIDQPFASWSRASDASRLASRLAKTLAAPQAFEAWSSIPITIESLCLHRGHIEFENARGERFELRRFKACAEIRVAEALEIEIQRLSDVLLHEGRPLLALAGGVNGDPRFGLQLPRMTIDAWLRAESTRALEFRTRIRASAVPASALHLLGLAAQTKDGGDGELIADGRLDRERGLNFALQTDHFAVAGWADRTFDGRKPSERTTATPLACVCSADARGRELYSCRSSPAHVRPRIEAISMR